MVDTKELAHCAKVIYDTMTLSDITSPTLVERAKTVKEGVLELAARVEELETAAENYNEDIDNLRARVDSLATRERMWKEKASSMEEQLNKQTETAKAWMKVAAKNARLIEQYRRRVTLVEELNENGEDISDLKYEIEKCREKLLKGETC